MKKKIFQVFDPTVEEPVVRQSVHGEVIETNDIDTVILDCSAMTYIDIDGLNMLKTVVIR